MPKRAMRHVEQRGATGRTGVDDLEHRLEVAIEVGHGTYPAFELESLLAFVPPTMRQATRKRRACISTTSRASRRPGK